MSTPFLTHLTNSLGNKTKILSELRKTFVRPLIQIAVKAIENEHIDEGILDRISTKYNLSEESVDEYYAAVYTVLTVNLKLQSHNIKIAEFKQSLEELKLSPDCIEDLAAVIYGQKQSDLYKGMVKKTRFYPYLVSCRWRIDITIASSILNRVLEPNVIMEWILDTGECLIFELSLGQFHQLRHAISKILVEFQALEQNSTLKNIQYS